MWNRDNENCYIDLANSIVKQACDDYMSAKRKLIKAQAKMDDIQNGLATEIDLMKINNDIIRYTLTIESYITFFQSEYAQSLSDTDLMCLKRKMDEKIKKEVEK